jgi:hypothetical protein
MTQRSSGPADLVSAQITHGSTGNVAVAIADPAQLPAGARVP